MSEQSAGTSNAGILAVGWIVTSAGISGLLVAIGFVVDVAFQERLGYQLPFWRSTTAYLHLAGEFLTVSLAQSIEWFADHLVLGFGAIILVSAFVYIRRWFVRRTDASNAEKPAVREKPLLLLLLIGALVSEFLLHDAPALEIRGLLIYGVETPQSSFSRKEISESSFQIWRDTVCSRISSISDTESHSPDDLCSSSSDTHGMRLRDRFIKNLLFTAALVYVTALVIRRYRNQTLSPTCAVLIIFNIVNLVFLPYVYAKTIKPTLFNEVIIRMTRATIGSDASESMVRAEHGFLLSQDDKTLVVFHKEESQIWHVPRSAVMLVKVERRGDPVEFHLKRALEGLPFSEVEPL